MYAALPGITGKLELEYEGEMKGADVVVRELIRTAAGKIYDKYFAEVNTQQIEQWFNLGGTVKLDDDQPTAAALIDLKEIQGLFEKLSAVGVKTSDQPQRCRCSGGVSAGRHGSASEAEPQRRAWVFFAGEGAAQAGAHGCRGGLSGLATAAAANAARRVELEVRD